MITAIEIQPHKTFIYNERHSQTTPEDIIKRWGISLAQSALTLKSTTRKLVRLANYAFGAQIQSISNIHGKPLVM